MQACMIFLIAIAKMNSKVKLMLIGKSDKQKNPDIRKFVLKGISGQRLNINNLFFFYDTNKQGFPLRFFDMRYQFSS